MNLLLTGANGFVGKNLIDLFLKGSDYNLVCTTRNKSGNLYHQRIKWIVLKDFSNKIQWKDYLLGVDCIIHLAGLAHSSNSDKDKDLININYFATKHLASCANELGIKKFIFLSTAKVNGECSKRNKPFQREDSANPKNLYSESKYRTELMLNNICKNSSLSLIIIRSPLIYGPGVKANFKLIYNLAKFGIPVPFGLFNNKRSFLSIDNLFDLFNNIIKYRGELNELFYASDDDDISTNDLIKKISKISGKKFMIFKFPKKFILIISKIFLLNNQINKMYSTLQVDISYTKKRISWNPKFTMDYTLKRMQ